MDTLKDYYIEFPEPEEAPRPGKASPFADSPYDSPYTRPQPAPKPPVRKQKKGGKRWLAVLLVCVLLLTACGATALIQGAIYRDRMDQLRLGLEQQISALERRLDSVERDPAAVYTPAAPGEAMVPGQIYAQVVDSVVCIVAEGQSQGEYIGSTGSGFIFTEDGYVVTNYHVVQGMTDLYVVLNDKTELEAELTGYDASADIAVLKVEQENLPYAQTGSSDALAVGEQVVAIGYPLSSETPSMTVGYISAKDQVVSTDGSVSNMLQTDAAINSGNSGGPLFNSAGQVVGITTSKFSGYSSSGVSIEGMGFAIPMDDVLQMLQDLMEFGYITGAYLGVYVRDVDAYVQAYGLPAGAYVDEPMAGYAAEKAGLLTGDVITAVGGYKVTSVADLTLALRRLEAGEEVTVTVWRSGQEVHLKVVLDEKPREEAAQPEEVLPQETQPQEDFSFDEWFGIPFEELFPEP